MSANVNNQEQVKTLEYFNKTHLITKNDILEDINKLIKEYESCLKSGDKYHSPKYYEIAVDFLKKTYKEIEKREFFKGPDFWAYYYILNAMGLKILYGHFDKYEIPKEKDYNSKINSVTIGEKFVLCEYTCRLLSTNEYASMYDTTEATIRQWIRRGKIKEAVRIGNLWKIPALAEFKKNGFRSASYEWNRNEVEFTDEYKFLKDYDRVYIHQSDDDSSIFDIELQVANENEIGNFKTVEILKYDVKQKEKIEVYLISHSEVELSRLSIKTEVHLEKKNLFGN